MINPKYTLQNRLDRVISIKQKIEKKLKHSYRLTEQRVAELTLTRFKLLLEAERLNAILHPVKTSTQEILELQQSLKNCEDDRKTIEWKKKRIKKLEENISRESGTMEILVNGIKKKNPVAVLPSDILTERLF